MKVMLGELRGQPLVLRNSFVGGHLVDGFCRKA
jgi:hypothetical protein